MGFVSCGGGGGGGREGNTATKMALRRLKLEVLTKETCESEGEYIQYRYLYISLMVSTSGLLIEHSWV
jgi:hypothetical protein